MNTEKIPTNVHELWGNYDPWDLIDEKFDQNQERQAQKMIKLVTRRISMRVRILAAVLVFVHTSGLVLSAGEASMTNGAWWN